MRLLLCIALSALVGASGASKKVHSAVHILKTDHDGLDVGWEEELQELAKEESLKTQCSRFYCYRRIQNDEHCGKEHACFKMWFKKKNYILRTLGAEYMNAWEEFISHQFGGKGTHGCTVVPKGNDAEITCVYRKKKRGRGGRPKLETQAQRNEVEA